MRRLLTLGFISAIVLPGLAHAQTVSEVIGLFNIVTGIIFVCAFTTFGGGLISYGVNFGNAERIQGIKLMEWGVAILFVLVVLLGIAQFLQGHGGATNVIAALVVIAVVVGGAISILTAEEPEEPVKKKEEK